MPPKTNSKVFEESRQVLPEPPKLLVVDAEALQNLVNFVAQAPLPLGRDQLVQAVVNSARPAEVQETPES